MTYQPLSAGSLDKRVTIQSRSSTDDSGGGRASITWAYVASVSAKIEPGTGREFFEAKQITPDLSHLVTIRYRRGMSSAQHIVYVSDNVTRVFAIHSHADPMERHEQLILMCSEQPPV